VLNEVCYRLQQRVAGFEIGRIPRQKGQAEFFLLGLMMARFAVETFRVDER
jgi:hypothetical protein